MSIPLRTSKGKWSLLSFRVTVYAL